jgi:acetate kinase
MLVLVVNPGSSTMKVVLLDENDRVLGREELSAQGGRVEHDAFVKALEQMHAADAIGLRVVHGGSRFTQPVLIDDAVVEELRNLADLAPLHQGAALAALDLLAKELPGAPVVACFDTAFHATLPPAAATYAIPAGWRETYGARRFGFHGLSHAYAARRAAALLRRAPDTLMVVTCHLGAGASLAAVRHGQCVDTTMGFTPLEGLVMATRSGTVDPGLVLWLQEHARLEANHIRHVLEHESGLFALAGTSDMRELLERVERRDAEAQQAVDVYLHRLCAGITAMAASMGGMDAVVFTGGVGENAAVIRARVAEQLAFLGLAVDSVRNDTAKEDLDISEATARVKTIVVHAREDHEIARGVRHALDNR